MGCTSGRISIKKYSPERKDGRREEGKEGRKEGKGVMLKEAGSYEETRHWK